MLDTSSTVMVTTVGAPATNTVARRANKSMAVVLDLPEHLQAPPDPLPQLDGQEPDPHTWVIDPIWAKKCLRCGAYPVELYCNPLYCNPDWEAGMPPEGICASCDLTLGTGPS